MSATVGAGAPSSLGLDSLLDFDMAVTLDGARLSAEEIQAMLSGSDGLQRIRGQWVEVNHERLAGLIERFRQIESDNRDGLTLADVMRLLSGTTLEGPAPDPNWSEVVAGAWLADTLRHLRSPAGLAAFDLAVATEIAAEQRVSDAQESLRVITSALAGELQKPPADMPLRGPIPDNPAHWVNQATRANPNLKAAQAAVKVAAAGVGIEQAGHLPTLGVTASYQREHTSGNPAGNEDIKLRQATLGLAVPVFAGGGVSAHVTQAQRQLDAAHDQAELVNRQTVQQVRAAFLGVLSGISQVNALRQSVASNRIALKATQIGLQVGNETLTDVLLAVQNLEAAQTAFAQARDAYLTSVLALQQAAGSANALDVQAVSALLTEPAPAPNVATPTMPASAATTPVVPSAASSARPAG